MGVEAESYDWLLQNHLEKLIVRSKAMSDEQWNWKPSPPSPCAREIVEHACIWLLTDRLQIEAQQDLLTWRAPALPDGREQMIAELEAESARWRKMLTTMDDSVLNEPRRRHGIFPSTVRFFVQHMVQNVSYKSGQLATLFFAQGLDGAEPFVAPMPNELQDLIANAIANPLIEAVVREESNRVEQLIEEGSDPNKKVSRNATALHFAAYVRNPNITEILLKAGADPNAQDVDGYTPLINAVSECDQQTAEILI